MASDKVFNVMFLCQRNSARSIMAEAILNFLGKGYFKAYSAGSEPSGELTKEAVDIIKRSNMSVDGLRSKSWDEFLASDAPKLDFVFTVCDDTMEAGCPTWPGQPMTAHWGVPDPVACDGNIAEIGAAYADSFRMLYNRISVFTSLPLASIDHLVLQERLDAIGQSDRDSKASA